jgi:transposase-like protein
MSDPDDGFTESDLDDSDGDTDWWEDAAADRTRLWLRLIERVQELGYVARACDEFGVHRTAFYRIWSCYRRGGEPKLFELALRAVARSPEGRHRLETAVLRMTAQHPNWGRKRVAKALQNRGYNITPAQVLNVWRRYDLNKPERNPADKSE